ncbi:50S ribosomal protein L10 [soil metagenome]
MVLRLKDKKAIVEKIASIAAASVVVLAADYRGLTAAQMTQLRASARKSGIYIRIIRNTLAKRALENTSFASISDKLTGPIVLAFSSEDPGALARLFRDFAKQNNKLSAKVLSLGAKVYEAKDLDAIANLPTRDEALATVMLVLKAPITKLVRTLAEPYAQVVRVLAAIGDKK